MLNSEATEAAKEKLAKIKDAFTAWVWTDPDRTDRLARLYNDRFNNLVPRRFDGRHLTLPGASSIIRLYDHQKRVIWRIVAVRLDLHRPRGRRRQILRHRRRDHGAEAARPDQQGDAGGARPLPGAGLPRIPAALSDRPHPGRRRDQLREGEAVPLPGPRGDGELGRGHHHPCGVPLHPGAGRLRARDDRGADRLLRRPLLRSRRRRPHHPQAHRGDEGEAGREAGGAEGPTRRHADPGRDRHRPDHRRRGAGIPEAQLRHQPGEPEGRRSGRLAAGLGPVRQGALPRPQAARPRADPGLGHADHQHAGRDVHPAAVPGAGGAAGARRARVRRLGVGLRRHHAPNSSCSRAAPTSR